MDLSGAGYLPAGALNSTAFVGVWTLWDNFGVYGAVAAITMSERARLLMVICGKCGHENSDGHQFCEACDEYLVWRGKSVSATMAGLSPTELRVTPGATATSKVRVFNRGAIVDKYHLEVPAEIASWATIEPSSLNLYPSTDGEAALTFHPTRSPEVRAGEVSFAVKVCSEVDPSATAEAAGTVTVEPFVELAGKLVPTTSRSTGSAEHQVKIGNGGNAPAEVSLTVSNPDEQLGFELEPASMTLQPGEGASVTLRVTPRAAEEVAQGVPQTFRIVLRSPGASDVTLDGAYLRVTKIVLEGSIEPPASTARGTAEHWITLTNRGNSPAAIALAATDPGQLLTFQLTPSNVTVDPGAVQKVRLWVALRGNGEGPQDPAERRGKALPFQVVARAGEAAPVEVNGTYTPLFVDLEAALEPKVSRGRDVGQQALTIVNRGNQPAPVSITATDPEGALTLAVSPSRVTIEPGAGARLMVRASLRDPSSGARSAPLPFEVQVVGQGSEPVKVEGAFQPLFAALTVTLDPPASEGIGAGDHWVVVTNTGNLAADAMITASDPGGVFRFEADPPGLSLGPGATARVRLRLTPRWTPRGNPVPRPFGVQVTSSSAPTVVAQGTRTPLRPQHGPRRWPAILLRVLIAFAILIVATLIALATTGVDLSIVDGSTAFQIPFVSLAVAALGVLGFLIFIPRRGWFIAVGVLAAGAVGVWLASTQQMLKL